MNIEELRAEARRIVDEADEEQLVRFIHHFEDEGGDEEGFKEWRQQELVEIEEIRQRYLRGEEKTYSLEEIQTMMRDRVESYGRVQA